MYRGFVFVLVLAAATSRSLPAGDDGTAEIAAGDAAWAERSGERDADGRLTRTAVDRAIAAYAAAAQKRPADLQLRCRWIEALYFLGHFVLTDEAAQRTVFERARDGARETMRLLAKKAGVADLEALPVDRQVGLLRNLPEARPVYFWSAITWGVWGMSAGYYAAGRDGVAARIRDEATVLLRLDEEYADAGGLRLLGRLHTVTPRIPFATWWIDRRRGVELLRRAHALSRRDPRNALFLAEALLELQPDRRDEALDLLREAAAVQPDPAHAVEDQENIDAARDRLARETAPPT